nr:hypothetical protein [Candidatus Sigynarchaeota archaeon]
MNATDTSNPSSDATERVLAAVKGLKDNFDKHYAEIESRVKKSTEGPVKTFTIDDDIPIVLQLSVWDAKLGPVTAMLVGESKFIETIPVAEQDNSTRMMDVLVPGETCDLSKGNVSRFMIKFAITNPSLRGSEAWLLVVVYYDTTISIPKAIIDDMLKEMARCWHDDAALSIEAMGIRDRFNAVTSRWKEYLMELRRSIWSLVAKARDIEPAKPAVVIDVPDAVDVAKEPSKTGCIERKPVVKKDKNKSRGIGALVKHASDGMKKIMGTMTKESMLNLEPARAEHGSSLAAAKLPTLPLSITTTPPVPIVAPGFPATTPRSLTAPPAPATSLATEPHRTPRAVTIPSVDNVVTEPDVDDGTTPAIDQLEAITSAPAREPVKITLNPGRPDNGSVTPAMKHPAIIPPKILSQHVEPQIVDVLGKLQRSGFSVKVDKDTWEATACRLVELDPGKPGLVAFILSFHAKFLPSPVLHMIDGKFYANDERTVIEPYRPAIKDIIAKHVPGADELTYRKVVIGRVFKDKPVKAMLVPIVLVRDAIRDGASKVPFWWVEPDKLSGTHGYFVLVASEIDHLDKFLMNTLRALGGKAVLAEATHVDEVVKDIAVTGKTGRVLAFMTVAVGIIGLLSIARVLPID